MTAVVAGKQVAGMEMATAPVPIGADSPLVCDTSKKFVRELGRSASGLVRFEFSMGWEDMSVELALPAKAFDQFCQFHQVTHISTATAKLGDEGLAATSAQTQSD